LNHWDIQVITLPDFRVVPTKAATQGNRCDIPQTLRTPCHARDREIAVILV